MRTVLPGLLILALAACGTAPLRPIAGVGGACSEQRLDRLVFGMDTPDGAIDDAEWQRFLRDSVTPRFPDGLTVYDTRGQWRGADGRVVRESSRVVEIVHDDGEDGRRRIAGIAEDYRQRYRQEAVLVISQRVTACL